MDNDVLNTLEAARYVRLSKPTLERARVAGDGPLYCKLGGSVRYRRADLDAWLESRLTASTSASGRGPAQSNDPRQTDNVCRRPNAHPS
jgi:excisionase family DNA binding protein